MENSNLIGKEGHGFSRTIKGPIYIRVNQPTLNRNIDKCNLPHIWDGILINTPELQIKHQWEHPEHLQEQPTSLTPPTTYI